MHEGKVTLEPNHHLAKVVRLSEVDDGLAELFIPLIRRFHQFLGINLLKKPSFGCDWSINQIRQEVQDNIGKFLNCRERRTPCRFPPLSKVSVT